MEVTARYEHFFPPSPFPLAYKFGTMHNTQYQGAEYIFSSLFVSTYTFTVHSAFQKQHTIQGGLMIWSALFRHTLSLNFIVHNTHHSGEG